MKNFLNSSLFAGLATIITGLSAVIIYFRQKNDTKVQAARVLLTEIRSAEERIEQIREKITTGMTADFPPVLILKSWKTYSHLFISDFDQDELKLINTFFDFCEIIEDFCKRNNDFFWITTEERARVVQQKLAECVVASQTDTTIDLNDLKQKLLDVYASDSYTYSPQKTINAIKITLDKVQNLTTSSCGIKLKKIAKM